MTNSLRARTLINLSAVLYEQSAARLSLSAKVSNIDLNFVPSVAFISNVYIADSLRARTLINLSAVLYEQAAARTSLSAEVSNIDLNFVPSVAFISDVHMANSLRARTLINLSAVLYEQAAARTSLSAKVSNISLPAKVSIIDLDFVPSVAFDAIENIELIGDLLGDADCVNNNNNNIIPTLQFSLTALLNLRSLALKRSVLSGSDLNCGHNIEELIYVGKVKNNRNNLNIIVTNSTSREFGRVDMKSLTRLCLLIDGAKANVADVFDTVVSKSDKVPTQELSSYIKIELLRDNSRKFYRLVITSEDTHYKQIIKKAYIILLERALLILFIT
ncbi:hypothetical protein HBH61_057780 [Parastagonospora nodorum]|nr:hypothetical protein HBH61_057780 [Parastagonospora nodorum]